MPNINKLLNKVNQNLKQSSLQKESAQIASIGYKGGINTEEVDKLQEQAEKARQDLENRRQTLQKGLSAKNSAKKKAKAPKPGFIDLDYPIDSDYDNHIVFETRPRKKRKVVISYQKKVYLLDYLYLKVDSTQRQKQNMKLQK